MAARLRELVGQIRKAKGNFFLCRLALRLQFDPSKHAVADSDENIAALRAACAELGYEVPIPQER